MESQNSNQQDQQKASEPAPQNQEENKDNNSNHDNAKDPSANEVQAQPENLPVQRVVVVEPEAVVRPPTPEDIPLRPDTETIKLLSLIIGRLRLLEKNIAIYNDDLRDLHQQREFKLNQIQEELSVMYEDYSQYLNQQHEQEKELEQRVRVEIDYNLVRVVEQKLKMDVQVYIMRKKLHQRTVAMRELQVQNYDLKQQNKDLHSRVSELEGKVEEREKEVRRMQDIVYDVTTLNIKPNFAMGSNQLSVPKFKNYDQYMIQQQKELQQQKYFMDNQTLKFGRKYNEVLKDGIWQTQLMKPSPSHGSLLANTGKLMLQGGDYGASGGERRLGGVMHGMSLNDLHPESWLNNKFTSTIEKPKFEDTINERESGYGEGISSNKASSLRSGAGKQSPQGSDYRLGQRQYY